ncbi:class I SAM-dependent methyltransferase [Hungatella hathewayi]|uniref:class I SAM-dependent methyltransferase n=1 Tax=Hungatella hathewayi TaxID=154046 RepID=UPI00356647B4
MNKMQLKDKIFSVIGLEPESNIVIWGAGAKGQEVLQLLREWGVKVYGFCDRNEAKQGTGINGVFCYAPQELRNIADLTIIYSVYKDQAFYEELCRQYDRVVEGEVLALIGSTPLFSGYDYFYPLGHFYNLYPDLTEIDERSNELFNKNKTIEGIDFNEKEQRETLNRMTALYETIPDWREYGDGEPSSYRYRYLNLSFSPGDTVGLHCMLRILQPKKMIEVGSGWSSAVTLDTNEYYLKNQIDLKFIEPYPALLKSILKENDQISLMENGLQEVPLETFDELDEGDLLFIDSTHVAKIGSDVNYLFFEIFPRLKAGVYIHLHDIFYPFEYPKEWLRQGMVWNELYLLRAFLMNNHDYEIVFFQNMMEQKHMDIFLEKWPLEYPVHGGSIWLKKTNGVKGGTDK